MWFCCCCCGLYFLLGGGGGMTLSWKLIHYMLKNKYQQIIISFNKECQQKGYIWYIFDSESIFKNYTLYEWDPVLVADKSSLTISFLFMSFVISFWVVFSLSLSPLLEHILSLSWGVMGYQKGTTVLSLCQGSFMAVEVKCRCQSWLDVWSRHTVEPWLLSLNILRWAFRFHVQSHRRFKSTLY